jgi:predicted AAA+ superfamily ATPase
MGMERNILGDLLKWKNSKHRKPLLLLGVRQCGKTWALREFGGRHYKNFVHIDFFEEEKYRQYFEGTKNAERILDRLRLLGHNIEPENTLLILDEIQECPNALGALKYFCENSPEYHVACAGSLLGVRLAKGTSFPVGKVDYLKLRPMSFAEFLNADSNPELADFISGIVKIESIDELLFERLTDKLKIYYAVGGMPEAVQAWVHERNMARVEQVLGANLNSYDFDFSKHLSAAEAQKTSRVWRSLPSQLAKENKKFIYNLVKGNARAREWEPAVTWLCDADLTVKVNRVGRPELPLSSCDDLSSFKLYAANVGLLRKLSSLAAETISQGNDLFSTFRGAFSENYILNALSAQYETPLRYWAVHNPSAEVDFILQRGDDVIPVEVKSDRNIKSKGLKRYRDLYGDSINICLRYSLHNLHYQDGILNIPLFLAGRTEALIDAAK